MKASGYARAGDDYYCEPPWIVEALHGVERLPGLVWDPSCGSGNIPKTLMALGVNCIGSDIADRGYGGVQDFFTSHGCVDHIVSNPPYGVIEDYVRHALVITRRKVCILARLALLEGQCRDALFSETPLARVWVSRRRVSMPPGGTDVKPKGGSIAYAWFVWEHGHIGLPTVGRI